MSQGAKSLDILTGWADICAALGPNVSVKQARGWREKHGLPVEYMGRRPTARMADLKKWGDEFFRV